MKTEGRLAVKLKNGHFWTALISVAFVLTALIIFLVDSLNDQISFSYVVSSMLCIYVASLCIFSDQITSRIRVDKKFTAICILIIAIEITATVFTVLTVRKYAVLQNELDGLYARWTAIDKVTDASLEVYNEYVELSRGMENFYLRMGILFMLWWVSPFIVAFIRPKFAESEQKEKAGE